MGYLIRIGTSARKEHQLAQSSNPPESIRQGYHPCSLRLSWRKARKSQWWANLPKTTWKKTKRTTNEWTWIKSKKSGWNLNSRKHDFYIAIKIYRSSSYYLFLVVLHNVVVQPFIVLSYFFYTFLYNLMGLDDWL